MADELPGDKEEGPLLRNSRPSKLHHGGGASQQQIVSDFPLGEGLYTPDVELSPWRVDGARGKTRAMRLEAILDGARGARLGCLDAKVALFLGGHITALAVAFLCETDLAAALREGASFRSAPAAYAKLALLVMCLGGNTMLYVSLYRSDPGWITGGTAPGGAPACTADGGGLAPPCPWCTLPGPLRRRHDHNTGQCVARFDHYCPLLATAVGSRNAARFFWFCASQTFLLLWGILLVLHALLPCLPLWQDSATQCWSRQPLRTGILVAAGCALSLLLNAIGGLLILHGYMAATNQTTYELLKGSDVPYLRPYFERYKGPSAITLPRGTARLIRRHFQGIPPPAPFSMGVPDNLNSFFYGGNLPGLPVQLKEGTAQLAV